jgi:CBS domain containing-hemolysin-like protein
VIWVLNGSARLFTRFIGLKPVSEREAHSEEELKIILSESLKRGEINPSEYKYVNKIFEFDNRIAKEIMVPRTEFIAIKKDMPIHDILEIVSKQNFTRYPVVDGDKDYIIGMLNTKQLFIDMMFMSEEEKSRISVEEYTRPVIEVIEYAPLHELLKRMQREHIPMAILIDEYGGTAGLITIEDILEEIIGDSRNGFEEDAQALRKNRLNGKAVLDKPIPLTEPNSVFQTTFTDQKSEAMGGLIVNHQHKTNRVNVSRMNGQ